jgi:hypothetical protein
VGIAKLELPGGIMTRTTCFSTLSCAALLAALAAYGCGSSSPVDTGTGGKAGGTGGTPVTGGTGGAVVTGGTGGSVVTGGQGGAIVTGGQGGMQGGRPDAGVGRPDAGVGRPDAGVGRPDAAPPADAGVNMCVANSACTMGFTCTATCMVGANAGTRACTCPANGRLNCPGACRLDDAGVVVPPPVDAAPRPDAGPACAANVRGGRACVLGTDTECARNAGGGNVQMCTCGLAVDGGADGGGVWTCL